MSLSAKRLKNIEESNLEGDLQILSTAIHQLQRFEGQGIVEIDSALNTFRQLNTSNRSESRSLIRTQLLKLLEEESEKKLVPKEFYYDAVYCVLLIWAKYWPCSTADAHPIVERRCSLYDDHRVIVSPIKKIFTASGHQYYLQYLLDSLPSAEPRELSTFSGCYPHIYKNLIQVDNADTKKPFSQRDMAHIEARSNDDLGYRLQEKANADSRFTHIGLSVALGALVALIALGVAVPLAAGLSYVAKSIILGMIGALPVVAGLIGYGIYKIKKYRVEKKILKSIANINAKNVPENAKILVSEKMLIPAPTISVSAPTVIAENKSDISAPDLTFFTTNQICTTQISAGLTQSEYELPLHMLNQAMNFVNRMMPDGAGNKKSSTPTAIAKFNKTRKMQLMNVFSLIFDGSISEGVYSCATQGGSCGSTAGLAQIYLCLHYPFNDRYGFYIYSFRKVDHAVTCLVDLQTQKPVAVCDPWLGIIFICNENNYQRYIAELCKEFIEPPQEIPTYTNFTDSLKILGRNCQEDGINRNTFDTEGKICVATHFYRDAYQLNGRLNPDIFNLTKQNLQNRLADLMKADESIVYYRQFFQWLKKKVDIKWTMTMITSCSFALSLQQYLSYLITTDRLKAHLALLFLERMKQIPDIAKNVEDTHFNCLFDGLVQCLSIRKKQTLTLLTKGTHSEKEELKASAVQFKTANKATVSYHLNSVFSSGMKEIKRESPVTIIEDYLYQSDTDKQKALSGQVNICSIM